MALEMEEAQAVDRADLVELVRLDPDAAAAEAVEIIEGRCFVDRGPFVPQASVLRDRDGRVDWRRARLDGRRGRIAWGAQRSALRGPRRRGRPRTGRPGGRTGRCRR